MIKKVLFACFFVLVGIFVDRYCYDSVNLYFNKTEAAAKAFSKAH